MSAERTVAMIWVSYLNPFAKRGLKGRSMNREIRVSRSLGRPSLLKKPSRDPSRRIGHLLIIDGERNEIDPSRWVSEVTAVTKTTVSPHWTRTDPFACFATFPVSIENGLPEKSFVLCEPYVFLFIYPVSDRGVEEGLPS